MIIDKKKFVCALIDADMDNKQLSKASGVSVTRISNIRNGQNTTWETLSKIAKALNVSEFDLMKEQAK